MTNPEQRWRLWRREDPLGLKIPLVIAELAIVWTVGVVLLAIVEAILGV